MYGVPRTKRGRHKLYRVFRNSVQFKTRSAVASRILKIDIVNSIDMQTRAQVQAINCAPVIVDNRESMALLC